MTHATQTLHYVEPAPFAPAAKAGLVSWLKAWRTRMERRRTLKRLLALDDRMLDDIGLSRWDLAHELGHYPARPGEVGSVLGATLAIRMRLGG